VTVTFIEAGDHLRLAVAENPRDVGIAEIIIHVLGSLGKIYRQKDISLDSYSSQTEIIVIDDPEAHPEQLRMLILRLSEGGVLIYRSDDVRAGELAPEPGLNIKKVACKVHGYFENRAGYFAATHNRTVKLNITGDSSMMSLSLAKEACLAAGIEEDNFYEAVKNYKQRS
jgi:hypothetical protein